MHFNVYIDDPTGQELAEVAQKCGQTRNALIRKALREWLEAQKKHGWPDEVMRFEGIPDMRPFESWRDRLKPPAPDPFA